MSTRERIAEILRVQVASLSEDDLRWPAPWSARVADVLMTELGLT